MIRYYVLDGGVSEVVSPATYKLMGGLSVWRVGEIAQARIANGETLQAVVNAIASTYGVYLAIVDDALSGQMIELSVAQSAIGTANEYAINSSVYVGWEYVAIPSAPTDAEIAAMIDLIVADQETATRTERLNFAASQINARAETAIDVAAFVADGLAWYDDAGSVSSQKASNFAALQAGNIIP